MKTEKQHLLATLLNKLTYSTSLNNKELIIPKATSYVMASLNPQKPHYNMAVCLLLNRAKDFETKPDSKILCEAFLKEVLEKKDELLLSQLGTQATRLFFAKASTRLTYKAFQLMIADPEFYLQNPICFEEVIFRMKRRKGDIQSDAECLKATNEATAFIERMI